MKKLFTFLLTFILAIGVGWAKTSTLTFTKACGGSGTADDGIKWTVTSDGKESTFDNSKGIHYGTSKVAVGNITLTTTGIKGTVTKVVVNASTASGVTATVGVTIGGAQFGSSAQSLTSSAKDYTFTGSASSESSPIVITVKKPSSASKALYVKSVAVTYEEGSTTVTPPSTPEIGFKQDGTTLTVNMTSSGAESIEYTTGFGGEEADNPTASGVKTTTYESPLTFDLTKQAMPYSIKAIAMNSEGDYSEVASATFDLPALTVSLSPTDGTTFNSSQQVTITTANAVGDAYVTYQIDGGAEQDYTAPFTITDTHTITASAIDDRAGKNGSATAKATYTKRGAELIATTLSFANATVTKYLGDDGNLYKQEASKSAADGTTPEGTITYAIDNNTDFDIDANTGDVTYEKAGTATITATFTPTDATKYSGSQASYKLTVVDPNVKAFRLVSDATTLMAGDKIIIASSATAGAAKAMSATQGDNNRQGVDVTVSSDLTVTPGTDVQVLTLENSSTTGQFYFNTGNGYLYAASSSGNQLKTEKTADGNASATIAISSNAATIKFTGPNTRNQIRYNSSNTLFSCYRSGQQNVYIYREDDNRTATTLTFADGNKEFKQGATEGTTFTNAATLSPVVEGATITYTSSDENIAVVDDKGEVLVTTEKTGTATITAMFAGSDNYRGSEASYTITVVEKPKTATKLTFAEGDKTFEQGTGDITITNVATLTPAVEGAKIDYKSNNEKIAIVESDGSVLVATEFPGTATITATYAGDDNYAADSASYTITVKHVEATVAKPTFSPAAGVYEYGTAITISAAEDCDIYYTDNNRNPKYSFSEDSIVGTKYDPATASLSITKNMTLKAIAVDKYGNSSDTARVTYTVKLPDAPTISPAGGAVAAGTVVTITPAEGAEYTIYTTDGTDPEWGKPIKGAEYEPGKTVITVTKPMTVKAITVAEHELVSEVAAVAYTLTGEVSDSLIFSKDYQSWKNFTGSYVTGQKNSTASDGNTYEFDVTDVLTQSDNLQLKRSSGKLVSPEWSAFTKGYKVTVTFSQNPIKITAGDATVTATDNSGEVSLDVADGSAFTIDVVDKYAQISKIAIYPAEITKVPRLVFTPAEGTYTQAQQVKISLAQQVEGVTIAYSTDGSTYQAVPAEGIQVKGKDQIIYARASMAGEPDREATATYHIIPAAPSITGYASTDLSEATTVTITTGEGGTKVRYRLNDGDEVIEEAPKATITVSAATKIEAWSENDEGTPSAQSTTVVFSWNGATHVKSIAEFLALDGGNKAGDKSIDKVVFDNPVTVLYDYAQHSSKTYQEYIWVKDATGYTQIFATPTLLSTSASNSTQAKYENGDVIPGGFTVSKQYYESGKYTQAYYSFTAGDEADANFQPATTKALADPYITTFAELQETPEKFNNAYVRVDKVKVTKASGKNFRFSDESGTEISDIVGYNKYSDDGSLKKDGSTAVVSVANSTNWQNVYGIFQAWNGGWEIMPIRFENWQANQMTLSELVETGKVGETYVISNQVEAVVAASSTSEMAQQYATYLGESTDLTDRILYVKDDNEAGAKGLNVNQKLTNENGWNDYVTAANIDGVVNDVPQSQLDQSNWCALILPEGKKASDYAGKIIADGTITGQYIDGTNPTMLVSSINDPAPEASSYVPNVYCAINFNDDYWENGAVCKSDEHHGTYFVMKPKVQEYALMVWLVYSNGKFYIPHTANSVNSHQFQGGVNVNWDMNRYSAGQDEQVGAPTCTEGKMYQFHAIVKRSTDAANAARRAATYDADTNSPLCQAFVIYPLDLSSESARTSIGQIDGDKQVQSVRYYNVAGVESQEPFSGVNIVVTRYTDGTQSARKIIRN